MTSKSLPHPTAIGYGCVVVPDLDEYQAFFIRDNKALWPRGHGRHDHGDGSGAHPIGALQAVCVESVLTKDWGRVASPPSLSPVDQAQVLLDQGVEGAEGTRTEMFPLKAMTVEEARVEIDALPEVIELKRRLVEQLAQPKQ
jgi:hypothetical protein